MSLTPSLRAQAEQIVRMWLISPRVGQKSTPLPRQRRALVEAIEKGLTTLARTVAQAQRTEDLAWVQTQAGMCGCASKMARAIESARLITDPEPER